MQSKVQVMCWCGVGSNPLKYDLGHLLTDLILHHTETWLVPVIASTVLMYCWWCVQRAPETCTVN